LGVKEKILAEFILDLAKKAEDSQEFRGKLVENGAEFEDQTIHIIYQNTIKLFPQIRKTAFLKGETVTQCTEERIKSAQEPTQNFTESRSKLSSAFPSLAMPNKNKDEIDLNLDFANLATPKEDGKRSRSSSSSRRRRRRRSSNSSDRHNRRRKRSRSGEKRDKERRSRERLRRSGRSESGSEERRHKRHKRDEVPKVGCIYKGV
jgi:ATP-dependent RNA helicase DHX8/PRP22